MPVFDVLQIMLVIIVGSIIFFTIILILTASFQRIKELFALTSNSRMRRKSRKSISKRGNLERKKVQELVKILLQPENKLHFENFVELLANIPFPDYPPNLIDKKGNEIPPSIEQIEEYEDEYEESLDEEDRMYDLYVYYLKSKNIQISESELSNVVELYKKIFKMNISRRETLELDISQIVKNAFPKKFNAWYPKASKNQKSYASRIFKTKINPSNN